MAAKRNYYESFATFLVDNGFAVCLWDYRGSGESAPTSLKNCSYRFSDYGIYDIPAILDFLNDKYPNQPKWIIGHSVGGQMIGFMSNLNKLSGLTAVATSTEYLGYMPWSFKLRSYYYFYLFSPIVHFIFGYNAVKLFGLMEDLPVPIVKEWRAWCQEPEYFFAKKYYGVTVPRGNYSAYTFPVYSYWASDDPIANNKSIPAYWSHIKSSKPIQINKRAKKIEHFGYFRKKFKDTIWQRILNDINSCID